jgi:hypothetical protein
MSFGICLGLAFWQQLTCDTTSRTSMRNLSQFVNRRSTVIISSMLVLTIFMGVPGQSQTTPPARPASVEGIVIDAVSSKAIAGVAVYPPAKPTAVPPVPRPSDEPPEIFTDKEGRFRRDDVPIVRGEVVFAKDGYRVSTYYRRFSDGEQINSLVIEMQPLAVVAGRVFDANGKPFAGSTVRLLRQRRVVSPKHLLWQQSETLVTQRSSSPCLVRAAGR